MTIVPRRRTDRRSVRAARPEPVGLSAPPPVPGLAPDRELLLRERVLREADRDAAPGRATVRRTGPRRRLVRVALPALACALVAVGVVAVDLARDVPEVPGRDTAVVAGGRTTGTAEAARLLGHVALAAAGAERSAVRADQFVYIESRVAYAAQSAAGGPVTMPPAHTRQVWSAADGRRSGLLREEGGPDTPLGAAAGGDRLDGRGATPRPAPASTAGPSVSAPTHLHVASLPTDPDTLLALVRDQTRGQGPDPDQRAFTAIGDLLAETWAPPRVEAALYRAASGIPGVTVVGTAVDAAGREGVAVARTSHGQQTQWVFDRTTYEFLGERTVLTEAGDAGPAGTVVGVSAVLVRAAVDRVGELPAPLTA
ncbi:CU044_5270 family protein [Streptomyces sp. NPDC056061]|uniref:CU044_5270 family protein n=1 Tax=Streptomyces sp. NPDC056061 TaxID=3345700 RepID=UPI0035DEDBAB